MKEFREIVKDFLHYVDLREKLGKKRVMDDWAVVCLAPFNGYPDFIPKVVFEKDKNSGIITVRAGENGFWNVKAFDYYLKGIKITGRESDEELESVFDKIWRAFFLFECLFVAQDILYIDCDKFDMFVRWRDREQGEMFQYFCDSKGGDMVIPVEGKRFDYEDYFDLISFVDWVREEIAKIDSGCYRKVVKNEA